MPSRLGLNSRTRRLIHRSALFLMLSIVATLATAAADDTVDKHLKGLDAYMEKIVKDWNVPGIGVGVVVKDRLVYAKGFGYRDYGKKLPFTPKTVMPIGSNTKLFTAVSAGFLVEEGKLDWDKPIRESVPSIRFYNDELNATISLRDMLSHRTGITRHDTIWYKSDFTRQELFDRLRFLEPSQPPRTTFLYNNMMYAGAGRIIEMLSGKSWEDFVRGHLLGPLGMNGTVFSIEDLEKQADHGVPYNERRDSFELYQIPYYREAFGIGPAGEINSNIEDMSKWLIALMNDGRFAGKQVIPPAVLKATLAPAISLPNSQLEARGYGEILNAAYGMARETASYRGHLMTLHGGDINGFHAQVAFLPTDGYGAVVLVIGDHAAPLYNVVAYNVFERLLGMEPTPWSERDLAIRLKEKEAGKQARAQAGGGRVAGTKPAHPLEDYTGEFEHPAYGVMTIAQKDGALSMDFHKIKLPLAHFHYERFDSPDDEEDGKWSLNFSTNPQGDVDTLRVSLDEAEVAFTRRVPAALSSPETLRQYAGAYVTPTGAGFQVVLKEDGTLGVVFAGQPFQALIPWKPRRFKVKEFSDVQFEFVVDGGRVVALKQIDPSGEYRFERK